MYPVHGHKHLDNDEFLESLSLQESDSVMFSKRWGTVLSKHKKSSQNNLHLLYHVIFIYFILLFSHCGYYFNKRLLAYALFTLTSSLSSLIVINPVLGKNLEHHRLTR